MTDARVRRGRDTEVLEATYLLPLFPDARAVAASLAGRDILGTSADDIERIHGDPVSSPVTRGIAPEVKARRRFMPAEAMAQAKRNAGKDMPMVIMRLPGQGEAQIDDWLAIFTNKDARELIGRAFGLGEYSRAAEQSSPEERREDPVTSFRARVESGSGYPRNEILPEFFSSLLYALGFESGDYEVEIRRRKSKPDQRSKRSRAKGV